MSSSSSNAEAAAPEVWERIRASFDKQGLMAHLGARLGDISPGQVHVLLPHRPEVTQQNGYVHAGATSAIADTAGGYAALSVFPSGAEVLSVDFTINLLAPAVGDYLDAVGTVVRAGRTLTVTQLQVFAVAGSQATLVALGQQTLICLPGEPPP